MKTGLTRRLWLPFAALALFTCQAMARPLLIPPQNLAVPPLPSAPDNPDIVTQYGALGIDQDTLLVAAYRPRDAEGNYESAVHIFERNTQGSWIYAGILTDADKKSIQALNRYQIEQGLVKAQLPLESLFVKEAFTMKG